MNKKSRMYDLAYAKYLQACINAMSKGERMRLNESEEYRHKKLAQLRRVWNEHSFGGDQCASC